MELTSILLHDGLGLQLDVKTVTRAPSVNKKAGVLTIDLNSSDDIIKVMQRKMRLRNHHKYYEVYIEEKDHQGHSMSDHPMLETVPPQILIKIYTFGLCD